MRGRTTAVCLTIVLVGVVIILGGQTLAGQRSVTPGTGTSYYTPVQVAPDADRVIWTMNLSNSLAEDWNMNVSYSFTGNSTLILRDAGTGLNYEHLYDGCINVGVPFGPCGGGRWFYFTLQPANSHKLQVAVHNNNTSVETLADTFVSFSYVTYPNTITGTNFSYIGGSVVGAGLIMLVVGVYRGVSKPPGIVKR